MQRIVCVVGVLLSLALGGAALGQGEDMIRPISRADLKGYARLLELREEQVQVVEMLHEGYMQALQRENAKMRKLMEEAEDAFSFDEPEEFDPEAMETAQEAMKKAEEKMIEAELAHIKTNLRLQDELFSDMRAMLEPGQVEVFPRVERMRLRQMILSEVGMGMAWTQVDLVDCIHTLGLSSEVSPEFDEGVHRYEIAMDRTLNELLSFALDMLEHVPEMMIDGDMDEQQKMMKKMFGLMGEMRTINKEHARKLGSHMSGPDRERFAWETTRRAFPEVYGQNETTEAINVAAGLGDLTGDQPERIRAIRVQFERELESANALWARALDEEAEEFDVESMFSFMGETESESEKAWRARMDLDQKFRERLEAVLTDEQIARLPVSRQREFDLQFAEQERLQRELEEAGEIVIDGPGGG